MAKIGQRRTILVNPAGRRKNGPRRKMSDKQIAHFGTKRQKASLAARRIAARANRAAPKKTRRPASRPAAKKRSNPGGILEAALVNPAPERRKSVAQQSKKKSSNNSRLHNTQKRQNPAAVAKPRHFTERIIVGKKRPVRRNPPLGGFIIGAGWALGGAVGSTMLTQAVLGINNTGFVGYGGNLATAFLLGTAVTMGLKDKDAGNFVILGGVIATLYRFIIDQTPLGSRLKNFGMGDYLAQSFLAPQRLENGLRNAQIQYPPAMRALAVPPVVIQTNGAAKLAGLSTIGRGLF